MKLEMLDVLIGLVTVYLTFGIVCTAVVEAIMAFFGSRSAILRTAMEQFLKGKTTGNQDFVEAFYDHPLVQTLHNDGWLSRILSRIPVIRRFSKNRPSYIPSEIVGRVVCSLVAGSSSSSSSANSAANPANSLFNSSKAGGRIGELLGGFDQEAHGNIIDFRKAIEDHFNAVMERASGWFRRHAQFWAVAVSAVIVFWINVDTVAIVTSLSSNPAARAKMVESAEKLVAQTTAIEGQAKAGNAQEGELKSAEEQAKEAYRVLINAAHDLKPAAIPLGWKDQPRNFIERVQMPGLWISIFAISLGAPFWFDVLSTFMKIRATGVSPEDKQRKE